MDGRDRRAGAVAGDLRAEKPDPGGARGDGALAACAAGRRRRAGVLPRSRPRLRRARIFLHRRRAGQALQADLGPARAGYSGRPDEETRRHGTVGAVARDRAGNLAAATSTGGMTGKLPGRVGDSPIIGAGTYADNATCAVSATGARRVLHPLRRRARNRRAHRVIAATRWPRRPARSSPNSAGSAAPAGSSRSSTTARSRCRSTAPACIAAIVRADGIIHTAIYDEPYRTG